ncbi:MAG: alpha/beta hydrolase fold domain-containing protein [Gemmatimonadales bacterium]
MLGLWACNGTDLGPDPAPGPPAHLTIAGGGQSGTAGAPLSEPIVARVTDAGGRALEGVRVAFAAPAGDGAFTPVNGLTDRSGEARTVWTLGSHSGPVVASASVEGWDAVSIPATALPGAPAQLAFEVQPGPVTAGVVFASPIVVMVQDQFGNRVATSTASIHLQLNKASLGGTLTVQAAGGLATFDDLHIDEAGEEYIITATAASLAASASTAFTVAPAPPPVPASVTVTPAMSGLLVGQTATLTATVLDAEGSPIPDAAVTWSSSDPSVAGVDGAGVVTALAPGSASITAATDGHDGTAEVSVSFGEGTLTGITSCTIGAVDNLMDVYLPAASHSRPLPVAVHVHGGGWVSGTRSTGVRFADLKDRLLQRGYLVASLDYRLAPTHKFPAQIQDVKCAIRHLRARAARYGLDPGRIGAWGGSAGGQLVALLGTAGETAGFDDVGDFQGVSSAVQAVVAQSAITDFTHPDELRDDYHRAFETWPDPDSPEMIAASPVTHVGAGDAPFFLIVGEEDTLVLPAQSARMNQLLQDVGVTSSLLRVQHADHDLQPVGADPIDPSAGTIATRIVNFLDQELR